MTFKEKNTTVFLMNSILIFGYYIINVVKIIQDNRFNPVDVYILWATVIVLGIIGTIIATIVTQIVFATVHQIRMNEEPTFVEDERDNLIDLKGIKVNYYIYSIGVLLSMLSLVFGYEPLVMFNMLIGSAFIGDIIGHVSRLYFYRQGF